MKTAALAILLLLHPVHVSVTGIEFNPDTRVYDIFVKVYCDDLLSDMKLTSISIGNEKEVTDEEFCKYLKDKIKIRENGKDIDLRVVTSESDGVERRFTLSAKGKKDTKEVTIINTIMTRLHSDQSNMVMFKYKNIEDACKFTISDTLRNYQVR